MEKIGKIFGAGAVFFAAVVAVVFTLIPGTASAQIIPSGLAWRGDDDDGGITIIGYIGTAEVLDVPERIAGKPVTSIGVGAFNNCVSLMSITLPSTLTSVGDLAFAGCTNLGSIVLPAGVARIGQYTFAACTSLWEVILPASLISIGEQAFRGCMSLETIRLPDWVIDIADSAFADCWNLTNISISRNTRVDESVFPRGVLLTYRTPASPPVSRAAVPAGDLRELGFRTVRVGETISLADLAPRTEGVRWVNSTPSSFRVTAQGDVTGIAIGNGFVRVGNDGYISIAVVPGETFYLVPEWQAALLPPGSKTDSGTAAEVLLEYRTEPTFRLAYRFNNKGESRGASGPNGGIDILARGEQYQWLGTTYHGGGWFYDLNGIKREMINGYQRDDAAGVELTVKPEFVYDNGVPYLQLRHLLHNRTGATVQGQRFGASADVMIHRNDAASLIATPEGAYMSDSAENPTLELILLCLDGDGITPSDTLWLGTWGGGQHLGYIYADARKDVVGADSAIGFSYQDISLKPRETKQFVIRFTLARREGATVPTAPADVASAPTTSSPAATAEIPDGLEWAAHGPGIIITGYTGTASTLIIPDRIDGNPVTAIRGNAFSGCIGVTSISIPNGVTEIGYEAFSGCTGLIHISIPNGVTYISESVFRDCTSLTSIDLPASLITIGGNAFKGCSSLRNVTLSRKTHVVGTDAFPAGARITYSD